MRTTLTMFCILVASLSSFSQDKSFDLSKYKFPDYKRHELELNLYSNGSSSRRTQEMTLIDRDTSFVSSNSNSNSSIDINYQFNHLTRKRIDYLSSQFSGKYDYSINEGYESKSKSYSPQMSWFLDGSRRTYLQEDKFFLEGLANLNYWFDESKSTFTNRDDTKSSQNYFDVSIGFGAGTGRMEKVSDLWQTYYILEKLKTQNSLSRELEEKDIFEVATFVSKLKNKRFFDARLQKIAELTALDSVLQKQGLVEDTDIAYFTTLNDYWSYGSFPNRESGKVLKIWLSPEYNMYSRKPNEGNAEFSDKTSLVSNISFNCTKQLNLYWERKLNVLISNETLIDSTGAYYSNYPANRIYTGANFGYGYFPNSRTSISGYLGYSGQNFVILNSSSEIPNDWMNWIYFDLTAYYYISPQIQISGSLRMNYSDKSYNENNSFFMNHNLGIRYAIF
jgi:hypothetical protein